VLLPEFVGTVMICRLTKFDTPICNDSLIIAMKQM